MNINIQFSKLEFNRWKVLRVAYKLIIALALLAVVADFAFLYLYFYQPIAEARTTVNLTYDAIYQKINKTLFDKISKTNEERKQSPIPASIRDPFK